MIFGSVSAGYTFSAVTPECPSYFSCAEKYQKAPGTLSTVSPDPRNDKGILDPVLRKV